MDNSEMPFAEAINAMKRNLPIILSSFAETINDYALPYERIEPIITNLKPLISSITTLSEIHRLAERMGEHQFVLTGRIPRRLIEKSASCDLDEQLSKFCISDEQVNSTVLKCGIINDTAFQQSIKALYGGLYNLSIIGLVSILDRTLSEKSGQIKNVNFNTRYKSIVRQIQEKGDLYLDDLEAEDYLLFLTYPKALKLFGEDSDFTSEEPALLNRHWIMHGRTTKEYTRLECVKVLNMIYGTIRLAELGEQDKIASKDETD